MTPSFHCADQIGDSFERTMYTLGFIVIALTFLKLPGSETQKKPRLNRVKLMYGSFATQNVGDTFSQFWTPM